MTIMHKESRPGWYPDQKVRIIGYNAEGPIYVFRPAIYRLDTFYPDIIP